MRMTSSKVARALRSGGLPLLGLFLAGCAGAARPGTLAPAARPQILFDDFSYTSVQPFLDHGWIVRTAPGHPGISGTTWWTGGVTFHDDPAHPGNRVLRMTSETDGTGANSRQTQFCQARKFHAGTYAARVRFTDAPEAGPDGDQIVETFYTISPLKAPMDPDYSEIDFEYLPNGGWGGTGPAMFMTTWETFQPEPLIQDNVHDRAPVSLAGWHTLLVQVADSTVRYFVDGKQLAQHGARVYPEVPMSINFNLWFTQEGLVDSHELRRYQEDVDWVFHAANTVLSPEEVDRRVADLRREKVGFVDSVPALSPPLASPCDF